MSKASESDQTVVAIDDVVKALSRLGTLTWQHRQMIKDGDVLSLLEQFVAGQRSAEWMYICGVVAFGAHFLFGVLAGQLNWISAVISMILVVELRRQRSTIRDVTVVVRQFADSLGYEVSTREAQLLTELRSQYTLTYQQNQMLKAGEVVPLAKQIVKATKRSGWIQLCVMTGCGLPQLLQTAESSGQPSVLNSFVLTALVMGGGQFLMMAGLAVYLGLGQFRRARRLEELIGEHPADVAALNAGQELESDRDSPYRSPQFR